MTDGEARDEINTMLNEAWDDVDALVEAEDTVVALRWKGRKVDEEPQGFWARVSHQTISQKLTSMCDEGTLQTKRRYETYGVTTLQLFAPMQSRNGFSKGLAIGSMLRDAFRAASLDGDIWYIDPRLSDLPDDGSSHRWNIISDFRYDTII